MTYQETTLKAVLTDLSAAEAGTPEDVWQSVQIFDEEEQEWLEVDATYELAETVNGLVGVQLLNGDFDEWAPETLARTSKDRADHPADEDEEYYEEEDDDEEDDSI